MGSWHFIVLQTVIVAVWIAINVYHLFNARVDRISFIFLNLAFSTQAAYAAPLILLAGNLDEPELEQAPRLALLDATAEYGRDRGSSTAPSGAHDLDLH